MRWTIKPVPEQQHVTGLQQALGVDSLIAGLLVQRGIQTYDAARRFFKPALSDLHDPFQMQDMEKAVARILKARNEDEGILIYGDYDVDGTTAVALLYSYLEKKHSKVATYIPDRYKEGYGVSLAGIDFALDNGFTLIIALDCGIKATEQVKYARDRGIDFIICDHHRPGIVLPDAVAVLDPKREDCSYPYKELCGCGVGFKLIQALGSTEGETITDLVPYLDLVATAIAADIVPITGENRILATFGLQVINTHARPGIEALRKQREKTVLTITDVVFGLAPRINAAGRMEHGQLAVQLLTETDQDRANHYAHLIESHNADRKGLDREITEQALELIRSNREEKNLTTVVYREDWHKGVIGIVASRLTETYYRPTLVFTRSGETLAASARSVKGFDVYEALERCSEHLLQFGGHTYAAGLTMEPEKYDTFKQKFEACVKETIDPGLLIPEILIDQVIDIQQITPKMVRILNRFAPFGPGNRTPVFMSSGLQDSGYAKQVGSDLKHLKFSVSQGDCGPLGAIGFNLGDKLDLVKSGRPLKLVYSIEENEWMGQKNVQLKVKDIK